MELFHSPKCRQDQISQAADKIHEPPVARQQLCGITGQCTQLKELVQARIEVGGTKEYLPIYMADVSEILLGLDYLQQRKAVLDFGDMIMEAGGNVVSL